MLLANGKIVKGANQENASYPVGICAERSTIATAHNLFPDLPIVTLALAAKKKDGEYTQEPVTPCGMCRQAIAECEKRYGKPIRILMASRSEIVVADNIKELLPHATKAHSHTEITASMQPRQAKRQTHAPSMSQWGAEPWKASIWHSRRPLP